MDNNCSLNLAGKYVEYSLIFLSIYYTFSSSSNMCVLFIHSEEHNYFWLGHSQLAQVASMAAVVVLLVASITTRPFVIHSKHVTPVSFSDMQKDFMDKMQQLYRDKDSFSLTTPPVLRQILYHNLLPCEPNFLEGHDISKCDIEDKQDVKLYRSTLRDTPDPFGNWSRDVCGLKPFNPATYRYTTGQIVFPSRKCEMCFLPFSGYVLRLPFPPANPKDLFFPLCVVAPMQIWFKTHVREDTFAIISDAIFISEDKRTIKRHQLSYERLLPIDLWWPTEKPVTHYRRLWLGHVLAFLCFLVFAYQVCAALMERHGGGQYQAYFPRLARAGLHILLVGLSLGLFIYFCVYDIRWESMIRALTVGPPSGVKANNDKAQHYYVTQMYESFTGHAGFDASVMWALVVLLLLQIMVLFTCAKGYIYGICHAIRRLVAPLLVALCWAMLLVLLAHAFNHEDNLTFRSFRVSFETLFITRYLGIRYEEEASVYLLILLHVTLFLLLPLFVGLVMADLNVSKALKRGRKRWWEATQH